MVVPHEGTWIEMMMVQLTIINHPVVPHEGTWIEIRITGPASVPGSVVPHEGTWIEISVKESFFRKMDCRSPRGNVD